MIYRNPMAQAGLMLLIVCAATPSAAATTKTFMAQPHDPLLAPYDTLCDRMETTVAPAEQWLHEGHALYFNAPIERHVHQIWFGDQGRMDGHKVARWQEMAAQFGYEHTLWSEQHLDFLQSIMPRKNFQLMCHLIERRAFSSASDVLRVFLLLHYGGIYCDVDISAPTYRGAVIDIATVVPLQNIVLLSEHHGRNIGSNNAIFAANGLMMAGAHHPMMQHLMDTMPANVEKFLSTDPWGLPDREVAYKTGPFFVNRSLSGPLTLLPMTYIRRLGMVD